MGSYGRVDYPVFAGRSESRKLFMDAIGLPLEGEGDGYYSSGSIAGSKHFGVWPLSQAAEACFGTTKWPADRVVPQASIKFEVENVEAVAAAGDELQRAGFELLHPVRSGQHSRWSYNPHRISERESTTTAGIAARCDYGSERFGHSPKM